MSYCAPQDVLTRLDHLSDSISSSLVLLAVADADAWINSKLDETNIPSSTPAAIVKAAEYYASASILHSLYDTDTAESPVAVRFEARAKELIDDYVTSNTSAAEIHPYSSSRTPGDSSFQRDEDLDIEEENINIRAILDGESDEWSP